MKVFTVPYLPDETYLEYVERVTSIPWVFYGENRNITIQGTSVTLGCDQPEGAGFEEAPVVITPQVSTVRNKTHAEVWEEIKQYRDFLQISGVKFGGYWFHNDVKSRGQWERMWNRCKDQGMSGSDPYLIDGEQVPWKTIPNSFVPLTAGLIYSVVEAMEVQEAKIFKAAELHRATMLALSDPTSYEYRTGWPEVYSS